MPKDDEISSVASKQLICQGNKPFSEIDNDASRSMFQEVDLQV